MKPKHCWSVTLCVNFAIVVTIYWDGWHKHWQIKSEQSWSPPGGWLQYSSYTPLSLYQQMGHGPKKNSTLHISSYRWCPSHFLLYWCLFFIGYLMLRRLFSLYWWTVELCSWLIRRAETEQAKHLSLHILYTDGIWTFGQELAWNFM